MVVALEFAVAVELTFLSPIGKFFGISTAFSAFISFLGFSTTVVRGLHTEEDFREIGPWIQGCGNYYLQNFTESGQVLEPGVFSGFGKEELEGFAELVRPYVSQAALRGIDY